MRKGELTRERIIAQAAPIFNQRGFAGCSMQDVMDATGLEKGGLYRHFSSKEELAAEAFNYAWARAAKVRLKIPASSGGAIERLRTHVRQFVAAPSQLPGGCPLLNTAIDADDGNAVLRRLVQNSLVDWRRRLSSIVVEGIKHGEIRKGTIPRRVANTIIAALEGAMMMSRLEATRTPLKDAQDSLEILLDGIAAN